MKSIVLRLLLVVFFIPMLSHAQSQTRVGQLLDEKSEIAFIQRYLNISPEEKLEINEIAKVELPSLAFVKAVGVAQRRGDFKQKDNFEWVQKPITAKVVVERQSCQSEEKKQFFEQTQQVKASWWQSAKQMIVKALCPECTVNRQVAASTLEYRPNVQRMMNEDGECIEGVQISLLVKGLSGAQASVSRKTVARYTPSEWQHMIGSYSPAWKFFIRSLWQVAEESFSEDERYSSTVAKRLHALELIDDPENYEPQKISQLIAFLERQQHVGVGDGCRLAMDFVEKTKRSIFFSEQDLAQCPELGKLRELPNPKMAQVKVQRIERMTVSSTAKQYDERIRHLLKRLSSRVQDASLKKVLEYRVQRSDFQTELVPRLQKTVEKKNLEGLAYYKAINENSRKVIAKMIESPHLKTMLKAEWLVTRQMSLLMSDLHAALKSSTLSVFGDREDLQVLRQNKQYVETVYSEISRQIGPSSQQFLKSVASR